MNEIGIGRQRRTATESKHTQKGRRHNTKGKIDHEQQKHRLVEQELKQEVHLNIYKGRRTQQRTGESKDSKIWHTDIHELNC